MTRKFSTFSAFLVAACTLNPLISYAADETAPQLVIPFEDLDINSDGSINEEEVNKSLSDLYANYKPLGTISFGAPKKQAEIEKNFSEEGFVDVNKKNILSYDQDENGSVSKEEYPIHKEYDLTKNQCDDFIKESQNTSPKNFGSIVKAMKDGASHKIRFCKDKYKL